MKNKKFTDIINPSETRTFNEATLSLNKDNPALTIDVPLLINVKPLITGGRFMSLWTKTKPDEYRVWDITPPPGQQRYAGIVIYFLSSALKHSSDMNINSERVPEARLQAMVGDHGCLSGSGSVGIGIGIDPCSLRRVLTNGIASLSESHQFPFDPDSDYPNISVSVGQCISGLWSAVR